MILEKAKLSPVILTVSTLSVLEGVGLEFRSVPGGSISDDVAAVATLLVGAVPFWFVVSLVGAVVADVVLDRTSRGLALRAVEFRAVAAQLTGVPVGCLRYGAHVRSAMFATAAGIFIAVQTGTGDAIIGTDLTLVSVAAAVLGGA